MAYLHIPLTRHHKTTRRPRWVVWLLGFSVLGISLFIVVGTNLWLTRNTVFAAAPEGTHTAVQLLLNRKTGFILQKILKNTPLISNRGLTIEDIAPFTNGEIGWFFHDDGTRSIAINSTAHQFPQELLDSQHIVRQEITPTVFLLSEKLQPVSGLRPKSTKKKLFPIFHKKLGLYYSAQQAKTVEIITSENGIYFPLASKISPNVGFDPSHIPEDTAFILSTPVLSNTFIHTDAFSSILDPLIGEPIQELFTSILSKNGVLIQTGKNNPSFLLFSEDQTPSLDRLRFLQTNLALKNPTIEKKRLADQSITSEIITDPSVISVEEITIGGRVFLRASSGTHTFLMSRDGEFILTNSEELLRFWLDVDAKTTVAQKCQTNIGLINTSDLMQTNHLSNAYQSNVLFSLSSSFKYLSIFESLGNLSILACYE